MCKLVKNPRLFYSCITLFMYLGPPPGAVIVLAKENIIPIDGNIVLIKVLHVLIISLGSFTMLLLAPVIIKCFISSLRSADADSLLDPHRRFIDCLQEVFFRIPRRTMSLPFKLLYFYGFFASIGTGPVLFFCLVYF